MLLIECILTVENQKRSFIFKGNVEVVSMNKMEQCLEFDELEIFEVKEGKKEIFKPKGHTFSGNKLDCQDAIGDVIARYSRNEQGLTILYMHNDIKNFVDEYKKEFITVENREIPYKVLHGSFPSVYNLLLITDFYTYYISEDDECLMLDTATGEVISDNYFASVGYEQSLESIEEGGERKIFHAFDNEQV